MCLLLLSLGCKAGTGCEGPAPQWQALATDVWLLQGAEGDSTPANRGRVANLVLARDGARLWLVGAGPTPAAARALDCHVRRRFGRPVSDVIVPWARGEQALGLRGWTSARHWTHATVAATMQRQCATCLEGLRDKLQAAASDLGPQPVLLPRRRFGGDSGRIGPWQWRALPRGEGQVALVFQHRRAPLLVAPGWLWGDAPPDARGGDVALVSASVAQLLAGAPPATQWIGEQGPPQATSEVQRVAAYWTVLQAAVAAALERGEAAVTPPPLPELPAAWAAHPQHALNWQRAWRQAEDRQFDPPRR